MRSTPLPRTSALQRRALARRTRWAPITEELRAVVRAGSRQPGELLPSTRDLAVSFGVHRQTIMTALDALCAEGLLVSEPRRGYRVAPAEAELPLPETGRAPLQPFEFRLRERGAGLSALPPELERATYPLHAATPDPGLLPLAELRASYAHVLSRGAGLLDGTDRWGNPALVRELTGYLRRARALLPERLLVTCGSQEGIALVARALLSPGDAVAVEDPGYFPAWGAFRASGAELVPIPVDAHGLRVDALARVLRRRRVRLVYVTPNHHYPTTVTLSAPRRQALLELTLAHGVPVLEDDYDHEYHFRGLPQAPLAASPAAPHVVYAASLSKLVAPGVRVGVLCGAESLLDALARLRESSVRTGDAITQAALADWIAGGGFERHVRRARRAYAQRREAALTALARAATRVPLELEAPAGGLAVWTTWPRHDVLELARRALARGVAVLPGPLAALESTPSGLRLAYGRVTPAEFERGLGLLVAEARRM